MPCAFRVSRLIAARHPGRAFASARLRCLHIAIHFRMTHSQTLSRASALPETRHPFMWMYRPLRRAKTAARDGLDGDFSAIYNHPVQRRLSAGSAVEVIVSPLRHDRAVADGTDAGPNGTGWIDPVRVPAQTGYQRGGRVAFKLRAETRLLEAVKTLFQGHNDGLRGVH